jgi:hypothetical protein
MKIIVDYDRIGGRWLERFTPLEFMLNLCYVVNQEFQSEFLVNVKIDRNG